MMSVPLGKIQILVGRGRKGVGRGVKGGGRGEDFLRVGKGVSPPLPRGIWSEIEKKFVLKIINKFFFSKTEGFQ